MNYGLTPAELRSGRPHHRHCADGQRPVAVQPHPPGPGAPCARRHPRCGGHSDGVSPCTPSSRTAAGPPPHLDRNLAYLGLVEILYGYPIDAVVLTTGCDKTTPAGIMAASTVDIPAIVLSGGPMLDGWHGGELVGSGTVIWRSPPATGGRRDR